MNTSKLTLDNVFLHILLYGPSGSFKTGFEGTCPSPYIADFDGGVLTLRGLDVSYDSFKDELRNGIRIKSAYKDFTSRMDDFEAQLSTTGKILYEGKEIKTFCVDSVTTLQSYIIAELCALNNKPKPTLNEWGILIELFRAFFTRLNKWPCHVVVTAHEEMIKDELTGEIRIRPLIVGKALPNELPLYFDEVYRTLVKKGDKGTEYMLQCQAGPNWSAKSRLGKGLLDVEKSDFGWILEKVKGEKR